MTEQEVQEVCKQMSGMSIEDFADLTKTVTQEVYRREQEIMQKIADLQSFLSNNKDIAKIMHIGLVFAAASDDVGTDETTLDGLCIAGAGSSVNVCIDALRKEAKD